MGQIMAKAGEPEAEEGDQYVLVSFMEKGSGDLLKWPRRSDILNVLKEDILFSCQPPAPCAATSSSRSLTYCLSKAEAKKANELFMTKAYYYLTKTTGTFSVFKCVSFGSVHMYECEVEYRVVSVCVGVCVFGRVCVCMHDKICVAVWPISLVR